MWMNVKPFLASVKVVTASTQWVLTSANALRDTSRARQATDVKVRLQTSARLHQTAEIHCESTRAFKNLRIALLAGQSPRLAK